MDYCFSYKNPFSSSLLQSIPSKSKTFNHNFPVPLNFFGNFGCGISFSGKTNRKAFLVLASNGVGSSSSSEYGGEYRRGLNTPLQPRSAAGRLLSSVLLNDPEYFPQVVQKQLEQLVVDRYDALGRMNFSSASDEACLHRYAIVQLNIDSNKDRSIFFS